jgi:23S rRNA-intervening sequence protein
MKTDNQKIGAEQNIQAIDYWGEILGKSLLFAKAASEIEVEFSLNKKMALKTRPILLPMNIAKARQSSGEEFVRFISLAKQSIKEIEQQFSAAVQQGLVQPEIVKQPLFMSAELYSLLNDLRQQSS